MRKISSANEHAAETRLTKGGEAMGNVDGEDGSRFSMAWNKGKDANLKNDAMQIESLSDTTTTPTEGKICLYFCSL